MDCDSSLRGRTSHRVEELINRSAPFSIGNATVDRCDGWIGSLPTACQQITLTFIERETLSRCAALHNSLADSLKRSDYGLLRPWFSVLWCYSTGVRFRKSDACYHILSCVCVVRWSMLRVSAHHSQTLRWLLMRLTRSVGSLKKRECTAQFEFGTLCVSGQGITQNDLTLSKW